MSDHARGPGRPRRPRRRPARLGRAAAERLLDGDPGSESVHLVLAAACAPGRPEELRGEEAARVAFRAAPRTAPVREPAAPVAVRVLRRIVTAKVIAVIALTIGAGGVAIAATATSFDELTRPPSLPTVDTGRHIPVGPASGTRRAQLADDSPAPPPEEMRTDRDAEEPSTASGIVTTTPPAVPPPAPPGASAGPAAARPNASANGNGNGNGNGNERTTHTPPGQAKKDSTGTVTDQKKKDSPNDKGKSTGPAGPSTPLKKATQD